MTRIAVTKTGIPNAPARILTLKTEGLNKEPKQMFEQTFKNIDDILHKDAGCGSELDYIEQTSWVLFLKYLDDLEKDKATAALLSGKTYNNIIAPEYQWAK